MPSFPNRVCASLNICCSLAWPACSVEVVSVGAACRPASVVPFKSRSWLWRSPAPPMLLAVTRAIRLSSARNTGPHESMAKSNSRVRATCSRRLRAHPAAVATGVTGFTSSTRTLRKAELARCAGSKLANRVSGHDPPAMALRRRDSIGTWAASLASAAAVARSSCCTAALVSATVRSVVCGRRNALPAEVQFASMASSRRPVLEGINPARVSAALRHECSTPYSSRGTLAATGRTPRAARRCCRSAARTTRRAEPAQVSSNRGNMWPGYLAKATDVVSLSVPHKRSTHSCVPGRTRSRPSMHHLRSSRSLEVHTMAARKNCVSGTNAAITDLPAASCDSSKAWPAVGCTSACCASAPNASATTDTCTAPCPPHRTAGHSLLHTLATHSGGAARHTTARLPRTQQ